MDTTNGVARGNDQPPVVASGVGAREAGAGPDRLGDARDALFDASRKAERLAESVERLEARIGNQRPGYLYVPPDLDRNRRDVIGWTHALRDAVDRAANAVAGTAAYMDGEAQSVDQRWTTRTTGFLRGLLDAIVRGDGGGALHSAVPMIRTGVPDALREQARHVRDRMEELKSAMMVQAAQILPVV